MTVYCDTRQQKGKHTNIDGWFDRHGVEYAYQKLDFGDYMTDGSNVSVDTKKGIEELAGDIGRDHARFVRELDRAAEAGYRLVVLVETARPICEIDDVAGYVAKPCRMCEKRRWGDCSPVSAMRCTKYRSKPMQGGTIVRMLHTLEAKHAVRFEFVHPSSAARRICELLGVECR